MFKLSILTALALLMISKTHAGEKSLYDFLWLDPDKKVYVLQNKIHKKENSFYLDLGYISNYTSKFQDTQGFQVRAGYFIHEEWGLELVYNQYSNKNNTAYRDVRLINEAEPFIRRPDKTYAALLVWSPFYGKINTFNRIFYFDWSFGVGPAVVETKSNLKNVRNPTADSRFDGETYTGGIAKTNLKFHLNEHVHLGIEYMNTYYMAPGPNNPDSDKMRTNTDVILSVGFSY